MLKNIVRLVCKDLSLLSWSLLFYLSFFWLFCIFEVDYGSTDISLAAFFYMNGYIVTSLGGVPNKQKTDDLMMSLPITRKELLQSKYLGGTLVGVTLMITVLAINAWVGGTFDYHPQIHFAAIYLGFWFPIIVGIPLFYGKVNGWISWIVQVMFLLGYMYGIAPLLKSPFMVALFPVLLYPLSWFLAKYWYQKREF